MMSVKERGVKNMNKKKINVKIRRITNEHIKTNNKPSYTSE